MFPTIASGQRLRFSLVDEDSPLPIGRVIVYLSDGVLIAHRLLAQEGKKLGVRGDSVSARMDWIARESVVAVEAGFATRFFQFSPSEAELILERLYAASVLPAIRKTLVPARRVAYRKFYRLTANPMVDSWRRKWTPKPDDYVFGDLSDPSEQKRLRGIFKESPPSIVESILSDSIDPERKPFLSVSMHQGRAIAWVIGWSSESEIAVLALHIDWAFSNLGILRRLLRRTLDDQASETKKQLQVVARKSDAGVNRMLGKVGAISKGDAFGPTRHWSYRPET